MRKRIEAIANTVAIEPTLELVQLMGHDAVVGLVHDRGGCLEVHPVRIDAKGNVTLDRARIYYPGAIFGRHIPTEDDLRELRATPDAEMIFAHLEECLGPFPGSDTHRTTLSDFLSSHYDRALLFDFMDDPTSALPYWNNSPDKWPEHRDIPF